MEDWLKIILGIPAAIVIIITLPFVFMKSRLEVRKLRLEIEELENNKTDKEKNNILQRKINDNPFIFFSKLATYLGIISLIALFFFGIYIKAISVTLYFIVIISCLSGSIVTTTDILVFHTLWEGYRNWKKKNQKNN